MPVAILAQIVVRLPVAGFPRHLLHVDHVVQITSRNFRLATVAYVVFHAQSHAFHPTSARMRSATVICCALVARSAVAAN